MWQLCPQKGFNCSFGCSCKGGFNARVNLLRKQIIDSAVCEVCEQEDESADHVIVGCPFAKEFWAKLGIDLPMDTSNVASDLHNIQRYAVGSFGSEETGRVVFRSERTSKHPSDVDSVRH